MHFGNVFKSFCFCWEFFFIYRSYSNYYRFAVSAFRLTLYGILNTIFFFFFHFFSRFMYVMSIYGSFIFRIKFYVGGLLKLCLQKQNDLSFSFFFFFIFWNGFYDFNHPYRLKFIVDIESTCSNAKMSISLWAWTGTQWINHKMRWGREWMSQNEIDREKMYIYHQTKFYFFFIMFFFITNFEGKSLVNRSSVAMSMILWYCTMILNYMNYDKKKTKYKFSISIWTKKHKECIPFKVE